MTIASPRRTASLTDPDRSLLRAEQRTLHLAYVKLPALKNAHARRHLLEGFIRRLVMMQMGRLEIDSLVPPDGGSPLDTDAAALLNIHLNGFYLNLCGALDNLAWVLHFEWTLLPGVSEDTRSRQDCSLFGKKFLESLRERDQQLVAFLTSYTAWNRALRDFRDPAAHRIPLCAAPGVLPPERMAELRSKQEEALAAIDRGESSLPYLDDARSLASYMPVFVLSDTEGLSVKSIPGQIGADYHQFLEASKATLSAL